MTSPVENLRVRIRCPDCRTHFHARMNRVLHGDAVMCPLCQREMRFHNLPHWHVGEDEKAFVRRVEERTSRPHFEVD